MGLDGGRVSNAMGVPINQWIMNQLNERSKQIKVSPRDTDNLIYQANKTAWIRMVSSVDIDSDVDLKYYNGLVDGIKDKADLAKKFVLQGGSSIYNNQNGKISYQQRGGLSEAYNVAGSNEILEYGYRPMPGITSVKVTTQGKMGSLRSADIQIKVWDKHQLDIIDALFFKLGYTMFLEWGHTNYYNSNNGKLEQSETFSINPFSEGLTKEKIFNRISKNVIDSQGNYDAMLGMVTNFNFSYNQEGGFDCTIKLMALGILASGIKINNPKPLPDIQNGVIQQLVNTLIEIKKQELLDEKNRASQDQGPSDLADYPPCVRNRGGIKADVKKVDTNNKRISGQDEAVSLTINNTNYYFYKNKKYQTTGFSLTGNYDCQGNEILLDGVNEKLLKKTYEQIIEGNKKSIGYTYAPYSTKEQLIVLTEQGLTDRFRGSKYLNQPFSLDIKVGSTDYLAFNKFKQLVPIDNTKDYNVEAVLNFPSFVVSENAPFSLSQGPANSQFNTLGASNVPQITTQKKVADLLTLSRPVATLFGNNLNYRRSSGENLSINGNIDRGTLNLNTNSSRKNNLYYKSFVNYNNIATRGSITETHDFFVLFSYSADAISSEGKKIPISPTDIKPGSDQDKISQLIVNSLKDETQTWNLIRVQNSILTQSDIYREADIRIKKIYITLEKEISITIPTTTRISIGKDPVTQKEVFEDRTEQIEYKIHLQIDTNDLGIIGGLEVKKGLGFTIVDALSISNTQDTQSIETQAESENSLDVTDIQKSEALKYQSSFEVIIRTIQLYSLNNAINVGGIEKEYPKVSKLELTKSPYYQTFTKGLFSVGLFSNTLSGSISGFTSTNTEKECIDYDNKLVDGNLTDDEIIKLRSKFGFNFSLMGNKVSAKELLDSKALVDYSDLMTTYTVPYKVNIGVFEGTQVNHPVYVKLGFVLMILNHICSIYDVKKEDKNITPLVYFDFNPNTNICLSNAKQLSTNPYDILIPFEGTNEDFKSIIDPLVVEGDSIRPVSGSATKTTIFKPEDKENGDRLSVDLPKFKIAGSQDKLIYRGKPMNILVSTDYLLKTVAGYSKQDQSNDIYAKEFIEQILFDINKYLGDFNMFRLAYDDSGNTMHITDDQMSPNLENKYIDETNRTEFPLFGLGSLARSLEIRTEISSKLSNMIAISANSKKENLSSLSKTSDSFGFYNLGYNDRYIPTRGEITGSVVKISDATINSAIQFNKAIETYYSDTTPADSSVSHATNYFIERLSKIKGEEKGTRASAVIPVSLNFSTDGISGLGMGQAFTVSEQFLPQTYNLRLRDPYGEKDNINTVGFVVVGLDQTIEGNQWLSNVRANMMFLKKRQDFEQAKIRTEYAPSIGFKSTQRSSTSNYSNTNFVGSNNEAKAAAEAYLGSTLTDSAWSELISATFAEASADQTEKAYVMAVILNRVRSNFGNYGKTVYGQLRGKNQFESVTGKNTNNFTTGPNAKAETSIYGAAERILSSVPKNYLFFTSANRSLFYDEDGKPIEGRDSSNFDNAVKNYKLIGGSYFG
jgi:hypothetical protein